jgi:hypothetical protein
MNAFTFPQPGERTNASSVLVPEEYLCSLLITGALDYYAHPCPFKGCSHCDEYVRQWWAVWYLLSEKHQERIDTALDLEHTGYPEPQS